MEPKILRQFQIEYVEAPYMGQNKSGWSPIGDYVLVRPDAVARKSSGGIELPDDIADRMELAAITGVLVENGPQAFDYLKDKPVPGTRVIFEKYAGKPIIGEDGNSYRIMDCTAVGGQKSGNRT